MILNLMTKYFLLIFISFVFHAVFAQENKLNEKVLSFRVYLQQESIKVVSPSVEPSLIPIIVQNDTNAPVICKIGTAKKMIQHLKIKPHQSQTIVVDFKLYFPVFLTPLSPPFQELELKLSQSSYEIPHRQK